MARKNKQERFNARTAGKILDRLDAADGCCEEAFPDEAKPAPLNAGNPDKTPPGQLRRKIKGIYEGEFEVVAGANTYSPEDMLGFGKIKGHCYIEWFHLPRSAVKKLIEDFEAGKRGDEV